MDEESSEYMKCIEYKAGYKYQLNKEYVDTISITPDHDLSSPGEYVTLSTKGKIVIKKGYAWDGPSGPTVDTLNFMRGSLVHDALYQLMREEQLNRKKYRNAADQILRKICIEDGMCKIRAWWVYQGVDKFAESASLPRNRKKLLKAPLKANNLKF